MEKKICLDHPVLFTLQYYYSTYITYYSSEETTNQSQSYIVDAVINGAAVQLED